VKRWQLNPGVNRCHDVHGAFFSLPPRSTMSGNSSVRSLTEEGELGIEVCEDCGYTACKSCICATSRGASGSIAILRRVEAEPELTNADSGS
jgi:hypothetical protein